MLKLMETVTKTDVRASKLMIYKTHIETVRNGNLKGKWVEVFVDT